VLIFSDNLHIFCYRYKKTKLLGFDFLAVFLLLLFFISFFISSSSIQKKMLRRNVLIWNFFFVFPRAPALYLRKRTLRTYLPLGYGFHSASWISISSFDGLRTREESRRIESSEGQSISNSSHEGWGRKSTILFPLPSEMSVRLVYEVTPRRNESICCCCEEEADHRIIKSNWCGGVFKYFLPLFGFCLSPLCVLRHGY